VKNLVVDIGNTRTKVAVFEQEKLLINLHADTFTSDDLDRLLAEQPGIDNAIVSTVKERPDSLSDRLEKCMSFFIELTHQTRLPIKNGYHTPETLGKDRIAAAVGANRLYPDRNILLIDAGTAITYDFITSGNEYTGGFITPGLTMRFNALHHFTNKLPLLAPDMPKFYEGNHTENSIRGGVQYGLKGEVEQMISYYHNRYGNSLILLTGGDAPYFEKLIEKDNFVVPEITLIGLNTILAFNNSLNCIV